MDENPSNFDRMIAMADEVFAMRTDPDQISVTPEVMARLEAIHPATMGEVTDENGPIAWTLVLPTTRELMEKFLSGEINEGTLLDRTPLGVNYETLYLCSAMVLPEHRRKGLAKRLVLNSIEAMRRDHPIQELFVWVFSDGGKALVEEVARVTHLPLQYRHTPEIG